MDRSHTTVTPIFARSSGQTLRIWGWRLVVTAAVGLCACSGPEEGPLDITIPPEPFTIEVAAGNAQAAPAGAALPDSVVVSGHPSPIRAGDGEDVIGRIEWTVVSGGGTVRSDTTEINLSREVATSGNVRELGPESGAQLLRARIPDSQTEVHFTATAY